jgi:hypothetical protein
MFLGECYYFVDIAEGEAGYCIGTAIVESYPARCRVVEGGSGEYDVLNVSHTFIRLLR